MGSGRVDESQMCSYSGISSGQARRAKTRVVGREGEARLVANREGWAGYIGGAG